MDDATSAVDPEVEARILAALRDRRRRLDACVVVAYRKATIALADEVVYLEDGRVDDQGTHAELLARNPGYADLVNAYEQEARAGEVSSPMSTTGSRRPAPAGHRRVDLRDAHHRPRHRALAGAQATASAARSRFAVLSTVGRIVVPVAVQQTLDKGVNAPGGPDVALHRRWSR